MQRRLDWIVPLAFLVLPFGICARGLIHTSHYTVFFILGLVWVGYLMDNAMIRAFYWYAAAWLAFIIGYNFFLPGSTGQVYPMAMQMAIMLFVAGTLLHVISRSSLSDQAWFNVLCIAALIQAVIGILQVFVFDPVVWLISLVIPAGGQGYAPSGFLGNNNFLAAWLAFSIPLFLRRRWIFCVPVIIFALALANTRMAWIAASAGIVYYLWPILTSRRARFIFVAVIACAAAAYLLGTGRAFSHFERFDYWKSAIDMALSSGRFSTLFGNGMGAVWKVGDSLHSEYVEMFFSMGVVGLCILEAFIITTLLRCPSRRLNAVFIIMAVNVIGNHAAHLAPSAFFIIIIIALIERAKRLCLEGGQLS
jgi:O-antigen ligase